MKNLDVYYLYIPLNAKLCIIEKQMYILSKAEKQEYNTFREDRKKIEFLTGRVLLKYLLVQHLQISAPLIQLVKNQYGRPYLHPCHKSSLYFNISHTESLISIVLSPWERVGIDVEKTTINNFSLMRRVFKKKEINFVLRHPTWELQQKVFFLLWTRKEAVMKAEGVGFSMIPTSFTVPFVSGKVSNKNYHFYSSVLEPDIMLSLAISRLEQDLLPTCIFTPIEFNTLFY